MKYIFSEVPYRNIATHTRLSDGAVGRIIELPDSSTIHGSPNFVDISDYALIQDDPVDEVLPTVVPDTISNWRGKAIIEIYGLTSAVESALSSLSGNAGTVARAAWNGNADFTRNGTTVMSLAQSIGITKEQLDEMFVQASNLEV